jgi:hypothetical protein
LLTDTGFVLEPDFDRLAFGMFGKSRRDRRGEVFLKRFLGLFVSLRMARTHREPAVAELCQQFANRAFVQHDTKASLQFIPQIDPPPAHHRMSGWIGASLMRLFRLLSRLLMVII